jgi:spore germination cell wall hydrolase CwlJ-like protein
MLLWLATAVALVLSGPGTLQSLSTLAHPAAVAPADAPAEPLPPQAPPFQAAGESAADRERAVHCLAEAIYYEAGFEPEQGQRAVAQVVLNRVRDRNFPDTICGVVYQGSGRKTGCQFSFVCDGSLWRRPPKPPKWDEAKQLAAEAIDGYVVAAVGTATHYHTDYVDPWWRPTLVEITKIGAHVFYRWPGKAGLPSALKERYAGDETSVWQKLSGKVKGKGRRGSSRRA